MPRLEAELRQDLDEVFRWYELQLHLLNEEDRKLPQLLSLILIPERYLDRTLDELREQFASARKHLEYAAMLHLLTTTEALLRLDFKQHSKRKIKPALFRRFRKIGRERGEKIRLEEDILNTWIEEFPETARSIREFKGVVPLRDWLAHGRYWNPKLGRPVYDGTFRSQNVLRMGWPGRRIRLWASASEPTTWIKACCCRRRCTIGCRRGTWRGSSPM